MLDKTVWQLEGRIIYQQYSGDVSLQDMNDGRQAIIQLLDTHPSTLQKVHIIIDISGRDSLKPETMQLSSMRPLFIFEDHREFIGWFLIVQPRPNPVMRFIVLAAAKVGGFNLRIIRSMEDARTFLYRADITLHDDNQSSV